MKKNYYLNGETRIYKDPLKVTEEEPYRTPYDEDLEKFEKQQKKLKTIALSILLAGVIALNGYGIYKNMTQPEPVNDEYAYNYNYDENDYVDPIVNIRYVAPAGYTLTWIDGIPYAVKETVSYTNVSTVTDEQGKTRFVAPAGYTLENRNGQPVAVRKEKTMISPSEVREYSAPEGYVLVGNKCYRLETEEVSKGR